jgi:hypothetical protein
VLTVPEPPKTPEEQVKEVEKLLSDAQEKLNQASWALETLRKRLKSPRKSRRKSDS